MVHDSVGGFHVPHGGLRKRKRWRHGQSGGGSAMALAMALAARAGSAVVIVADATGAQSATANKADKKIVEVEWSKKRTWAYATRKQHALIARVCFPGHWHRERSGLTTTRGWVPLWICLQALPRSWKIYLRRTDGHDSNVGQTVKIIRKNTASPPGRWLPTAPLVLKQPPCTPGLRKSKISFLQYDPTEADYKSFQISKKKKISKWRVLSGVWRVRRRRQSSRYLNRPEHR